MPARVASLGPCMAYELHLRRSPSTGTPLDEAHLVARINAPHPAATPRPNALGTVWEVGAGRFPVTLARRPLPVPLPEGAPPVPEAIGLDVQLPWGIPENEFQQVLLRSAELATELGLELLDPQLGTTVTSLNVEAVTASWRSSSTYAIDRAGSVEDGRAARADTTDPLAEARSRGRVLLVVLAVAVVGYMLTELLLEWFWQAPLPPID